MRDGTVRGGWLPALPKGFRVAGMTRYPTGVSRLSLEPGRWYAAELIGEEFEEAIRSYSPIRVDQVVPKCSRQFTLAFFHANYPEGVQNKEYNLQTIERNRRFILARSTDHTPPRFLLIYPLTAEWLAEKFGIRIGADEDPQAWCISRR